MTTQFLDEIVLRVDFNNTAPGGRVKGSLRHSSSARRPGIGEMVYVHDDEGNACRARVDELSGQIVLLEPEWSSWTSKAPADAFHLAVA
jgi:hypothetical protein